jgi:hypothetical protein
MTFEGVVDRWFANSRFGFIEYRNSGVDCRIFFPAANIRNDYLGRVGHSTFDGALVRFRIEKTTYKGEEKTVAVDVRAVFEEPHTTSITEHREVSQVAKLQAGRCSAWLCREDGSHIFIHKNCVEPEFVDRFSELRTGDYVYHGVERNSACTGAWAACNAELFSRAENEKLRRGEPLTDPEPEVEVPVEPDTEPDSVLAPATRNVPLIQLILERRGKS